MAAIPGVKRRRFWEKEWFIEALAGGPPAATALVGAIREFAGQGTAKELAWIFLAIGVWLLLAWVVKVLRAREKDKQVQEEQSSRDLAGCAHVLWQLLRRECHLESESDNAIRVTIHRVVPRDPPGGEPEYLEQVIPYVGGEGGAVGRRFSVRSGIIGQAYRTGDPAVGVRKSDDYDAFLKELISEWHFASDEARTLCHDRRAWMAVPITGAQGKPIGIVYVDSNRDDVFDEQTQQFVITGCFGIAEYIRQRYK